MSVDIEAEIEKAVWRFQMHAAASIVGLMSEAGVTFATMDTRLKWKPGTTQKRIVNLLGGNELSLQRVARMFVALGRELTPQVANPLGPYASPAAPDGAASLTVSDPVDPAESPIPSPGGRV